MAGCNYEQNTPVLGANTGSKNTFGGVLLPSGVACQGLLFIDRRTSRESDAL